MVKSAEELIREKIRLHGQIPFDEFMDIALYSEFGYYTLLDHLGRGGDYYTSPRIHPIFGTLLCAQLFEMWRSLDEPEKFTIVEQGAGDTLLSDDILGAAEEIDNRFYDSIEYILYDVRTIETKNPKSKSVLANEMDLTDITGVVLSNELVDAFPVKLIQIAQGQVKEYFVVQDSDGNFVELLLEPSSDILKNYFSQEELESLPGYEGPVNLHLKDWTLNISKVLKRGYLITIDYGYERESYYSLEKSKRLLQTFYMHTTGSSPFQRVGKQDITAHVDFSALERAGVDNGFSTVYKGKQSEWLNLLGFQDLVKVIADQRRYRREINFVNQLISEQGVGSFKVLIQSKGLSDIESKFPDVSKWINSIQTSIGPNINHLSWVDNYNIS